jgi:surface polysaccharide O-acyltransferase-like enzyme
MVLGIYVAHLPIAIIFHNFAGILGLETYLRDLFLVAGTSIGTLIFIWAVSFTPLKRVLLR